ncbi:hypothetical protein PVAND_013322 [Polypedilum vanderplanki]|uniref:Uncharacterized protein n=1 Tax=Polypedilum vanderplanki TaxID=319348 RepID=A0A9J6CPC3_POLVA|nr:hypothetical protein PVAND_013322 [Polypedilum vanderplanki]
MPGNSAIATIAYQFLHHPEKKKNFITTCPDAGKIKSFVFQCDEIQSDLTCSQCDKRIADKDNSAKVNGEYIVNTKETLLWCYSCDRLFHLVCASITELSDSAAPYICDLCTTEPNNGSAKALAIDGRDKYTFAQRLESIKEAEYVSDDDESEVSQFFEQTLHVDFIDGQFNLRTIKKLFEEQQDQTLRLGEKLQEAKRENDELTTQLQETQEKLRLLQINVHRQTASKVKLERKPGIIYATDFEDGSSLNTTFNPRTMSGVNSTRYYSDSGAIEAMHKMEINHLRNVLPKIKEFSGEPSKWLTFERGVELWKREGRYDDLHLKFLIRDKLTGRAARLVDRLFETHSCAEIMGRLRQAFGNPQIVLEEARNEVRELRLPQKLTQAAIIDATTIISSYIEACRQARIQAHDRSLALLICNQLDSRYSEGYFAFFRAKYPGETLEEKLDVLLEYLESIREILPPGTYSPENKKNMKLKEGSFQLNTVSSSPTQQSNNTKRSQNQANKRPIAESYEVRDIKEAQHMGYYLDKVKDYAENCLNCGKKGHYTVQCRAYKSKALDDRLKFVDSKKLCRCCIIATDHQASQCNLKKQCGMRVSGRRCIAKHHCSLHNKSNANFGAAKSTSSSRGQDAHEYSSSRTDQYQGYPVPSASGGQNVMCIALPNDNHQCLTLSNNSTSKLKSSAQTIKLFRTIVEYKGRSATAFTVGDSAAEISIVKRSLVDALGITGPPAMIGIRWTDDSTKNLTGIKVTIPIRGVLPDSKQFLVQDCFAIDDFNLPPRSLNVEQLKRSFPHLQAVPFDSYQDAVPAILLGSRHAALVEAIKPIWEDGEGKPIGVFTKLGYSIYGGEINLHSQLNVLNSVASELSDVDLVTNEDLSRQLEFANSLDNLYLKPTGTQLTVDEKSAIEQAESGIVQLPSGHIQMPLIWRLVNGDKPKLPDNFAMVLRRQLAQEKKLSKTPELLEAFNNNFKSEIDDGYIRAATAADMHTTNNVNYVPMSLVVNANKRPIKTRNVYDASAKFKGTSLNANLLPGPNLLIDILKPHMKMRECSIAFTGDIKSMFNRFKIDPADQNCQRILWRANTAQSMQIFIKESMLFGPTCSPFVSQFGKNYIAHKFKNEFPATAESIKTEVYMDDWLTSVPTLEEAIQRASEGIKIFAAANMQLISIQSNSSELLTALPLAHVKKELIPLFTDTHVGYVSKVLGISWDTSSDKIVFEFNEDLLRDKFSITRVKPTKREQCSLIARIYDVIGLLAHCIIRARILLQHSWKKQIEWDQEIDDEDSKLWSEWLADLKKAATIQIPRQRTSLRSLAEAESLELHTFSDAGKEAIAAVSYLAVVHKQKRETSFVMAKAKVAPLKLKSKQEITEMPRLELLAALMGARLAAHIVMLHEHLAMKQYFWCDSEVVLRWIWNTNLKLPRFAISPISEILETTEINQWRYVDTKLNVADLATKFQTHDFSDPHSVWFIGPEFLRQEPEEWPSQTFTTTKKKEAVVCAHQIDMQETTRNGVVENPLDFFPKKLPPYDCALMSTIDKETGNVQLSAIMTQLIERKPSIYYCWPKLVRATARMLLVRNEVLIPALRSKRWRNRRTRRNIIAASRVKQPIAPEYIEMAELFLIRYMQHQIWHSEIKALQKGKRINNNELLSLNVFLDDDQILRIRSRVSLPYSEYSQKYAPIIPRLKERNSLTEIMLFHYHYMFRHVCIESQMAEFRSKFWMTALREWLKAVGSKCNHCKIEKSYQTPPKMASLPTYRVDRTLKPFEVTGLDCCGPFLVTANEELQKVWIMLFTCTVTRFIHLELIESMDTQSALAAISSAYAAHGPLVRLISDNGTNFVGANNILHKEQEQIIKDLRKCSEGVNEHYIAQLKEFRWIFIPVKAAWFGGFYERLIGEVKRGMREEISTEGIDILQFRVAMTESAHRLNCRPLTHLAISHEEEELLTPHHLAKNRPGWPLLPSAHTLKGSGKPTDVRASYVEGQKLADKITRRFNKYYLSELTQRTKWNKDEPPMNVGDLVLIIDPNYTRSCWERGIIHSFRPSRDGIPRVAEIKTTRGIKPHTVQHLVKIQVDRA